MELTTHAKYRVLERFNPQGTNIIMNMVTNCLQSGDYKIRKFDPKCTTYEIPHLRIIVVIDKKSRKIVTMYKKTIQ